MPYAQRFGLNRLSPLSMTEKEEKNPASDIIENNNNKSNSNFTIDGTEYKTQSEHGMSDSEYRDQYEMGNIHDPTLDTVMMRGGVDYDAFYNKYGEDADFEEHMKKNLSPEEYKRSLTENFSKDPYYDQIMSKGLGTTNTKAFNKKASLDDLQTSLDYVSMIDPTPISDGINLGISGVRGAHAYATGDMEGAKRFGKKALASGFYMIPGTDIGKIGKLNKFGKSKGRVYKPGMFMPESSKRNIGRGLTNFAFRKGKNTKLTDKISSGVSSVLGNNKVSSVIGKKTSELASGKGIVKSSKVGEQREG